MGGIACFFIRAVYDPQVWLKILNKHIMVIKIKYGINVAYKKNNFLKFESQKQKQKMEGKYHNLQTL